MLCTFSGSASEDKNTTHQAWQSEPMLSVFTKSCLWTERRERCVIKYTKQNSMKVLADFHNHLQYMQSYNSKVHQLWLRKYSRNWSVCQWRLPPYYHQNTKPRDLAEHVTKLPWESTKGKLHFLHNNNNTPYNSYSQCGCFVFQWQHTSQKEFDLPVFLFPSGMCIYPGVLLYSGSEQPLSVTLV